MKCWVQYSKLRSKIEKNDDKKKINKRKKKKKNKKKKSKSNDKNVKTNHVHAYHRVVKFDFDDFEVTLSNDNDDNYVYFYNIYINREATQKVVAIATINSVENNWIVDTKCSHFVRASA